MAAIMKESGFKIEFKVLEDWFIIQEIYTKENGLMIKVIYIKIANGQGIYYC